MNQVVNVLFYIVSATFIVAIPIHYINLLFWPDQHDWVLGWISLGLIILLFRTLWKSGYRIGQKA